MNTDDPGVFDTDLPTEYAHLAAHNGMDTQGLAQLAWWAVQVGSTKDCFPLTSMCNAFSTSSTKGYIVKWQACCAFFFLSNLGQNSHALSWDT